MASAKPFHKVLEIGCGEGNNIPLIKHINPECYYVAADIDEKLLESALRQGADEVFLIDPDKSSKKHLPYKEKTFDLILLIEVLEHLDDNTSDETLAEAARLCSSRCIASVPYEPLWRMMNMVRLKYLPSFGNTPGHIRHFNRKTFRHLVSQEFTVEDLRIQLPWLMLSATIKIDQNK